MAEYSKLVRDRIPEIIEMDGKEAVISILNDDDYRMELDKKLKEELDEYLQSGDVEELVDMVEVIYAILATRDILLEDFWAMREDKYREKGLFKDKIYLHTVLEDDRSDFYDDFTRIVRECNYNNTYKMAWAKALVEIASQRNPENNVISLEEISEKFIKYYWNQNTNHDIMQGQRNPKIVSIVKDIMGKYYEEYDMDKFSRCETTLKYHFKKEYEKSKRQIMQVLKRDVSHRFINLDRRTLTGIYEYEQGDDELVMDSKNIKTLRDNQRELIDLIDYRWGLMLEKFAGISDHDRIFDNDIDKEQLEKFRNYLY